MRPASRGIEHIDKVPCAADIASQYRYRNPLEPPNSLIVTISQSGETADTLSALRLAKQSARRCSEDRRLRGFCISLAT
jgi:glucosamine 6-phosphate synthetase-like amidotransferase/phosphosugar isomerase protein